MTVLFVPIVEQIADNQYRVVAGHTRVCTTAKRGYPLVVETADRQEITLDSFEYNAATRILTNLGREE